MIRLVTLVLIFALSGGLSEPIGHDCSTTTLYGKLWVHSHEEDTDTVKVYRPSTFGFPPSRGRDKFEIKENGTFVIHSVGRSDRLNEIAAHWKKLDKSTIRVEPDNSEMPPFDLRFVSCDEDRLTIKK
jgi:hypothetical protein